MGATRSPAPRGGGSLSPVWAPRRPVGAAAPRAEGELCGPRRGGTQDPGCRSQRPAYPGSAAPGPGVSRPALPAREGFPARPRDVKSSASAPPAATWHQRVPRRSRPRARAAPKPGAPGRGEPRGRGRNGRRGRGGGGAGGGGAGGGRTGRGGEEGERRRGGGRDARLPGALRGQRGRTLPAPPLPGTAAPSGRDPALPRAAGLLLREGGTLGAAVTLPGGGAGRGWGGAAGEASALSRGVPEGRGCQGLPRAPRHGPRPLRPAGRPSEGKDGGLGPGSLRPEGALRWPRLGVPLGFQGRMGARVRQLFRRPAFISGRPGRRASLGGALPWSRPRSPGP